MFCWEKLSLVTVINFLGCNIHPELGGIWEWILSWLYCRNTLHAYNSSADWSGRFYWFEWYSLSTPENISKWKIWNSFKLLLTECKLPRICRMIALTFLTLLAFSLSRHYAVWNIVKVWLSAVSSFSVNFKPYNFILWHTYSTLKNTIFLTFKT